MRQQQNEANTLLHHPYALTFTLYHTHPLKHIEVST